MRIGIVDTTFSRVDMGAIALDELKKAGIRADAERRTVPGIKDLAVECKRLLDGGCDIAMALGMVGGAPIDTQCAHEASLGIQQAKLMSGKHIVEAFVHENEAWSGRELESICQGRIRKHVRNAIALADDPASLSGNAGKGMRQGKDDEGPVSLDKGIVVGLVVARFNDEITGRMREAALRQLKKDGAEAVLLESPGVYDMPLLAKKLLMDKRVDGVAALGAVVKGGTSHDEVITKAAAASLGKLSLEFRKPVTLGIIGHNVDWEGAEKRAEEYGERAAAAAVEIIRTLRM
jgi:riboflavin synthase